MELFPEDFGEVKTNEELAALQKKFPRYDLGYIIQSAYLLRRREKEWMKRLWERYEEYADRQFLDEFKLQFRQRAWELYLGSTLLNRGLKLGRHDPSGPDFDIQNEKEERITWIEAVAMNKGIGDDRVPDIVVGRLQSIPEEEMLLRITNALDNKFKKFQKESKNEIVKGNEPYVIAIDRSDLDYIDGVLPLILKAVFGIGDLTLRIMAGGIRQENPESYWSRKTKIDKRSGKEVSTLFFEDKKHSGISALIYSQYSILDSPRAPEEMGENFIVVHNPLAENPLPEGIFPFGDEYRAEDNHIKKIRERRDWDRHNPF